MQKKDSYGWYVYPGNGHFLMINYTLIVSQICKYVSKVYRKSIFVKYRSYTVYGTITTVKYGKVREISSIDQFFWIV